MFRRDIVKKGIAVGGNIVVDYVKTIDSYPKQGNLSTIISLSKSVGGAPPNVLLDLSKMDSDIPLKAIGLIGYDEDGEYIVSAFKKHNVDTTLIKRDSSLRTSFSDVMTVNSTGARTFFHYRGTNQLLNIEHFDFNNIDADILHIGYALLLDALDSKDEEYGVVMARLLYKAQKNGLKTSLDVVSENSTRFSNIVPHSLKYCNYIIINEVEASLTTGISIRDDQDILITENMKLICERLFDMGVNDLVVIHAPEGGFAMDNQRMLYVQGSLNLPDGYIKGTVGAGDAFCAGILYSIYNDWNIPRALQVAVGAAACCLCEINATDGMMDIEGIERLYASMRKNNLF